jgi:hypothetical protein
LSSHALPKKNINKHPKLGEIVRTPLGLQAEVLGVTYDDAALPETGRAVVRYVGGGGGGLVAPLEPRLGSGSLASLG